MNQTENIGKKFIWAPIVELMRCTLTIIYEKPLHVSRFFAKLAHKLCITSDK